MNEGFFTGSQYFRSGNINTAYFMEGEEIKVKLDYKQQRSYPAGPF